MLLNQKLSIQKKEILEGNLNTINYGNGILGIENASEYYFNKPAKELNLAESTMLAGIPKSPDNYSPLNDLNAAKKRQKEILNALVNNKIITKDKRPDNGAKPSIQGVSCAFYTCSQQWRRIYLL